MFAKFRLGNFDIEDALLLGSPLEADVDKMKSLVEANRQITIRNIYKRLDLSNVIVDITKKKKCLHSTKKKSNYLVKDLISPPRVGFHIGKNHLEVMMKNC